MKKVLLTACVCAGLCWHSQAQIAPYTRTLNSAGGSSTGITGTHEWSVGEMVLVSTYAKPSIIVTQGVLQMETGETYVKPVNSLAGRMQAYPNPANAQVHLSYDMLQNGTLYYDLQDITGKRISSKQLKIVPGAQTEDILLQAIANGTYMLNVSFKAADGSQESTSFKIDKVQQ